MSHIVPAEAFNNHDLFTSHCKSLGIPTMHLLSFNSMGERHRRAHIIYWSLRKNGVDNENAELEVTRILGE